MTDILVHKNNLNSYLTALLGYISIYMENHYMYVCMCVEKLSAL